MQLLLLMRLLLLLAVLCWDRLVQVQVLLFFPQGVSSDFVIDFPGQLPAAA